jgi:hypothetical protein
VGPVGVRAAVEVAPPVVGLGDDAATTAAAPWSVDDWQAPSVVARAIPANAHSHLELLSLNLLISGPIHGGRPRRPLESGVPWELWVS